MKNKNLEKNIPTASEDDSRDIVSGVTIRQFKGLAKFTKWKNGYGTVGKEK